MVTRIPRHPSLLPRPKKVPLLEVLKDGHTRLEAWCGDCRRHAALPIHKLLSRHGVLPTQRLDEIEARLWCEACGSSDITLTPDGLSRPCRPNEGNYRQISDDEALKRGMISARFV